MLIMSMSHQSSSQPFRDNSLKKSVSQSQKHINIWIFFMSLLSGHTKKSESVPLEFSFSYMKPFLRPYNSSSFCQRSTWNIGIRQIYDNFNFYSHPCMNLTLLNLFLQCDNTDNNNYNLESVRTGIITINHSTWYILATWCKEPIHWKRTWCWERSREGREGGNRGWDS